MLQGVQNHQECDYNKTAIQFINTNQEVSYLFTLVLNYQKHGRFFCNLLHNKGPISYVQGYHPLCLRTNTFKILSCHLFIEHNYCAWIVDFNRATVRYLM